MRTTPPLGDDLQPHSPDFAISSVSHGSGGECHVSGNGTSANMAEEHLGPWNSFGHSKGINDVSAKWTRDPPQNHVGVSELLVYLH